MQVITPLSEEHFYNIGDSLDHLVHKNDKQFIEIYEFVAKNKKNIDFRKIIEYVRSHGSWVIHVLITILPYNHWINFFRHYNILRYYWSNELIQKIIDQNEMHIHIDTLNQIQNIKFHFIKLSGQYDMNYNFTSKILLKKIGLLVPSIDLMFENVNIYDFYAGTDVILWLGHCPKMNRGNNDSKNKPMIITLYPKTTRSLRPKKDVVVYRKSDFLIFVDRDCEKQIIVRIYSHVIQMEKILLLDSGYIDLNDPECLFVTARLYQYLNNTKNRLFESDPTKYIDPLNKYKLLSYKIKNASDLDYLIKHKYDRCYVCKKYYDSSVFLKTYESLCIDCAIISHGFKNEVIILENFVVFITGIRTKIGYATALKILRTGGNIIGTTRYPCFAIQNYASESDYDTWKHRLIIIRCDFTQIDSVYRMLELLKKYKINAFINNAFRTIRPSEWYEVNVREIENKLEDIYDPIVCKPLILQDNLLDIKSNEIKNIIYEPSNLANNSDDSKRSTKYECVIYEKNDSVIQLPTNIKFNQFKDIQDVVHDNSWDKSIEDIDPKEIVECMCINQIVPSLLINQMIQKLVEPKFLINVTSLEGQFGTIKNGSHVHTNMCKAALNMLIKSLIGNKNKVNVYTIDPGYVSGICPQNDIYPVHMDDAATRLMFPIIRYFNDGKPLDHGMTKMRNYLSEAW